MTTTTITSIRWDLIPEIVRVAFRTAHQPSDVYAACRALDSYVGNRGGTSAAWLSGRLFPVGWDEDEALFSAIRDDAHGESEAA